MSYQMKSLLKTRRNLFLLFAAVFICFASSSYAVNVPRLTGRVVDNANML
jgi:hypothetical protein